MLGADFLRGFFRGGFGNSPENILSRQLRRSGWVSWILYRLRQIIRPSSAGTVDSFENPGPEEDCLTSRDFGSSDSTNWTASLSFQGGTRLGSRSPRLKYLSISVRTCSRHPCKRNGMCCNLEFSAYTQSRLPHKSSVYVQASCDFNCLREITLIGNLNDVSPYALVVPGEDWRRILHLRWTRRRRKILPRHRREGCFSSAVFRSVVCVVPPVMKTVIGQYRLSLEGLVEQTQPTV